MPEQARAPQIKFTRCPHATIFLGQGERDEIIQGWSSESQVSLLRPISTFLPSPVPVSPLSPTHPSHLNSTLARETRDAKHLKWISLKFASFQFKIIFLKGKFEYPLHNLPIRNYPLQITFTVHCCCIDSCQLKCPLISCEFQSSHKFWSHFTPIFPPPTKHPPWPTSPQQRVLTVTFGAGPPSTSLPTLIPTY